MNELSPAARAALERFGTQTGDGLSVGRREALWRAAIVRTRPAPSEALLKLAALGLSCALGAGAFSLIRRPAPAGREAVEPAVNAQWRQSKDSVVVELGTVRVRPRGAAAVKVTTPQLQAQVQNAAALFEVSPGATTLLVESGEVAWRAPGRSGRVAAGGRITVTAAVQPLPVAARAPPVQSCEALEPAAYAACLETEAAGQGLAAEAALFELGMMAHDRGDLTEAARRFQAYGDRFPDGALAPEASIALMVDLRRNGELTEAAAEAARFGARFADEPRAEDVRRWAAQIP